jgi:hypothetical protein
MAYEEPSVKVIQELQATAVNIQSADQILVAVGEMYEVFEDEEVSAAYDALTDAGAQTFSWPGKKTTSVVDLAGVRKSIAEVDSQLNEYAPYPLSWSLRDPSTNQVFELDPLTDVSAIDQDGFTVAEGVSAAVARASGSAASAAKSREFHLEAGGFISDGIVTGDRVRLESSGVFSVLGTVDVTHDDHVFFTPDGHDATVKTAVSASDVGVICTRVGGAGDPETSGQLLVGSGATLELVNYTGLTITDDEYNFVVEPLIFDHAVGENVEVLVQDDEVTLATPAEYTDLITNSGYITIPTGDLTGREGSRVAIWAEWQAAGDGTTDAGDGNLLGSATLSLDSDDVGKKITVWDTVSETQVDGDLDAVAGQLSSAAGTFAAADVGKVIKIGSVFRRITSLVAASGPGIVTYSGAFITGTGVTFSVYDPDTRVIKAVDAANSEFVVDGTAFATGLTDTYMVVHSPVYRDLVDDTSNSDTVMRYSGSAISGQTGVGLSMSPIDIYAATVTYEVFPAFELLATYRALDVASVNDTLTAYEPSDLTDAGDVSKSNPLLWAGQAALVAMGTNDKPLLLLPVDLFADAATGSKTGYPEDKNEALGYLNALDLLEMKEGAYFLAPLTRHSTVRDAFVTHVLAMSQPEEKKERVTFLTYDMPLGEMESTTGIIEPGYDGGNKRILDSGQNFLSEHQLIPGNAVVIDTPAAFAGDYVIGAGSTEDELVLEGDNWLQSSGAFTDAAKEYEDEAADTSVAGQVTGSVTGQWKDVEVGDYLLLGTAARNITAIDATYTILTHDGLDLPVLAPAQTVSILRSHVGVNYHAKPLDESEQAAALKAIGQSRGSRRVVHMWPDSVGQITGTDAQGNEVEENVPSYFAAAAEAGRDSVMRPERSSTGEPLAGFVSLEHSNFYFKRSQLNTIAEGGWTILHQPVEGGTVKVRHLLTTDMSTVKTQELSVTKNVDNMAKVKRASAEPLLNDEHGRVNITQQFLSALAFPLQGILDYFVGQEQLVAGDDGTQPYAMTGLRKSPVSEDEILEDVEMNVPIPGNRMTVTFII